MFFYHLLLKYSKVLINNDNYSIIFSKKINKKNNFVNFKNIIISILKISFHQNLAYFLYLELHLIKKTWYPKLNVHS